MFAKVIIKIKEAQFFTDHRVYNVAYTAKKQGLKNT